MRAKHPQLALRSSKMAALAMRRRAHAAMEASGLILRWLMQSAAIFVSDLSCIARTLTRTQQRPGP